MIHKRQKELIEFLVARLQNIQGVKALYLKGSIARNESDEYSDVDLYCLVNDSIYDKMMVKREDILEEYRTILYKSKENFGIPQIVVIYDNNIHLDFYLTKEVPTQGTDSIKILLDPNNALEKYKRNKSIIENKAVVSYLNDVIYTFHEIEIAYRRNDTLWAMRLLSHILAYLSLVLCYMYDNEKPVLHMKGIQAKLPDKIKTQIEVIMNMMIPEELRSCTIKLIELCEDIIEGQKDEVKELLHIRYLKYIYRVIQEL